MSTRTPPAPLKQLPPKVRAALRSIVARAHLDAIDRGEYQWSIGKEPLRAAGTSLERTRSEIERKKREKNFIVRVNTGKDEIASYQVKNDVGTRIVEAIKFHAASRQRDAERSALFVRGTRVDWVGANQPTWESYQFAFRRAAEVLGNESELPILPYLHLWRHHFELKLKMIIVRAHEAQGSSMRFKGGHSLCELWTKAKPLVRWAWEGKPETARLAAVSKALRALDKLDSQSQLFRYPAKRDGNAAPLPKELHQFSRAALKHKLQEVAELLDDAAMWIAVRRFLKSGPAR